MNNGFLLNDYRNENEDESKEKQVALQRFERGRNQRKIKRRGVGNNITKGRKLIDAKKCKRIRCKQIKSKRVKNKRIKSKRVKNKRVKNKRIKNKRINSKQIRSKQIRSKQIKRKQIKSNQNQGKYKSFNIK